jgi:putative ABC transport system substrate-binding protein
MMERVSGIGRRTFGTAVIGTLATAAGRAPIHAQQAAIPTLGYLSILSPAGELFLERSRAGLRDLGYLEGRNIHIEFRFSEGNRDLLATHATELVNLGVDAILTHSGVGVAAAHKATATIPIIVASGPDLVALRYAASLARPGGNVTGLRYLAGDSFAKRLEFLKEVDPALTQVGVLFQRGSAFVASTLKDIGPTATALRLELRPQEASGFEQWRAAFSAWTQANVSGLLVHDNPEFISNAKPIAALAVQHRMRSIGSLEHAANGGLMAYSVDFGELFHRSAAFVDKVLKGTKPGDLPIEQPTRFHFAINLATARTLGVAVPPSILARADNVIE